MCTGNRAAATTYWINQQLYTLWKLSDECAEKHGRGIKHSNTEIAHGTCLAQICVGRHRDCVKPSTHDLLFFCEFSAPQVQFICNHNVLVKFQIKSGHYKHGDSIESFQGFICAFRVPFRRHLITDTTHFCYGQADVCKANFLILDLNAAEFVQEHSRFDYRLDCGIEEVDEKQRKIVKYLRTEYFPLFQRAGCHFIYSLPDFDCLPRARPIDWSVATTIDVEALHVFNISVELINGFLNNRWLDHGSCVDDLDDDHDHSNFGDYALAEHLGTCEGFQFHAFFGPPKVQALCSEEALFTIDIQDLCIYLQGGYKGELSHKFSGWKIVVVTDINVVQTEGGSIQQLRLDFTKARFCEGLSTCENNIDIDECLFFKIKTMFIRYIMLRYLIILEEYEHSDIYRIEVNVVEEGIYIEEDELIDLDLEFLEIEYRERLCITDTCNFDILTAVSQGCINNHFRCLWKASQISGGCISEWSFEKYFQAIFGPIQILLPRDSTCKTVILYLTLREGKFSLLDNLNNCIEGEQHSFSDWRIAFEVQIKLREYRKNHVISDGCLRDRESVGEFVNQQLILDFSTIKFSRKLSRLPGLYDEIHVSQTRSRQQALLRYITRHYFAELVKHGHHVLYTFPVWKPGSSCGFNDFAPNSFSFQFYGPCFGGEVTKHGGAYGLHGNRNMIVICGVVNKRRRPSCLPRCTWNWCSSQDISCGTVVVSRDVFLERWLLKELSVINCRTTFIPIFHGIDDCGEWNFELITIDGDGSSEKRSCDWHQISADCRKIVFEHRNKENWSYTHHSGDTCYIYDGGYNVCCSTSNTLVLPTVSRHGGCEIILSGTVELDMEFKGELKSWSTSAIAEWSYTISITSCGRGRGLEIHCKKFCDISDSGFSGDLDGVHHSFNDASTILKEKLGEMIFIEEKTIKRLKDSFCGIWPLFYNGAYAYTLCNPCFNERGDFTFELDSPLDDCGQVIVEDRHDICLPVKGHEYERPSYTPVVHNGYEHDTRPSDESVRSPTLISDGVGSPYSEHKDHHKYEGNGIPGYSEHGDHDKYEGNGIPAYSEHGDHHNKYEGNGITTYGDKKGSGEGKDKEYLHI